MEKRLLVRETNYSLSGCKYICLFFGAALLSGCGGPGDRPSLAKVEGVVTLDQQPVRGVLLRFEKEGFRASQGVTDSEGRYRLRYIRDIMGAAIGENSVTLFDNSGKQRIPATYSKEPQIRTVESGSNEINFELTSD